MGRQNPTSPREAKPGRRGGCPPQRRRATRNGGRLQRRRQRWQHQRREQGTRGEEDGNGADDDNTETRGTGGDQRGRSPGHRAAERGKRGGGCLLTVPLTSPNWGQARGWGHQQDHGETAVIPSRRPKTALQHSRRQPMVEPPPRRASMWSTTTCTQAVGGGGGCPGKGAPRRTKTGKPSWKVHRTTQGRQGARNRKKGVEPPPPSQLQQNRDMSAPEGGGCPLHGKRRGPEGLHPY